jgi:hypothetical protein
LDKIGHSAMRLVSSSPEFFAGPPNFAEYRFIDRGFNCPLQANDD